MNIMTDAVLWAAAFAVGFYLLFLATWVLYVAVMSFKERLPQLHWFAKFNAYLLLFLFGYPLDLLFNIVASVVIFQRLPKSWLFTGTLKYWIASDDKRREKHATMICQRLLNPFDPGHC